MRRIIIIILILLALFVSYIVFNQFDAGPAVFDVGKEGLKTTSLPELLQSIFKPPSFDKTNGYYRLWTLTEPAGVDIESDDVLLRYRRLHDPQFDTEKYVKEWNNSGDAWNIDKNDKGNYKELYAKWKAGLEKSSDWTTPPTDIQEDWGKVILEEKSHLLEMKSEFQLILDRYRKLIDTEFFEDFTLVTRDSLVLYKSPVPNLLAWLHAAKLYVAVNMLDAMEGNWEQGVSNILAHIAFNKKAVRTSRTLIVNLIGKACVRMSLQALDSLMNRKECPKEVFQQVIDGLPPIAQEEFGNSNQLLAEGFSISQSPLKESGLFFQPNRTQQYYYDFFARLYIADITPPYQWKFNPLETQPVVKGLFWWLQNPSGKLKFQAFHSEKVGYNLFVASFKGYAVKTFYDMTRIAAALHLNYTPGTPIKEILNGLDIYKELLDPCSGNPYIWNEEKQILYSIGFDKVDNGGGDTTRYKQIEGVDFAIPVVLYLK
jgi:hypothetical protein